MLNGSPFFQGKSTASILEHIFEVTGAPTEAELDHFADKDTKRLAVGVQVKKIKKWSKILKTDDEDLLGLLDEVFKIDP